MTAGMIPIGAREMRLRALGMLPDDHWSPKDVRLARKAIREKAKFDRVTYNLAYPPAQRDAEALAAGGVGDVDRQTMATRNDPKPPQLAPTPAVRRKPFSEQCATCKCWFHPTQPDDGGKE